MNEGGRRRRRIGFERRLLLLALLVGLPGVAVSLILLWTGEFTPKVRWTLALFLTLSWTGFAFSLRHRVVFPLQTLSNLLAALREGDFSIRVRGARRDDALGELLYEVNALTSNLHDERLDAMEAANLLRKIMAEIDVAIFAFDADRKLRLVNRAGERLLARPVERLTGADAADLGLAEFLDDHAPQVVERAFPGASGRWEARRSSFRQGGIPLQLLVVADLSRALRQEERLAWRRLIRVMGHELKNSLTPIRSIAGSLETMLRRDELPEDWGDDMRQGLAVIATRAASLNRFMDAYARLARLPEPEIEPLDLGSLIHRVVRLETRLPVDVTPGPDCRIEADPDQLEQLLINVRRNAVDASLETGGGVRVGWSSNGGHSEVWVEDDGPGLPESANLFVPFFTTKPGGSGIGLVLSRQIAEAHGGSLSIENRKTGAGCRARLRLPC